MDDILISHQNETILHEILAQSLHTLPARHSPPRVITPYYDLVSKIIGQGRLQCVQLVGQEQALLQSHFLRNNKIGFGSFQKSGRRHWLISLGS
jgi:hypothetical protein